MKRFVQNNDNHVNQVLISSPYIHLELRSEFCLNFFLLFSLSFSLYSFNHRRIIILIFFGIFIFYFHKMFL